MGLTHKSTGISAIDSSLIVKKEQPTDITVTLAGNPNVGKSTLFNNLTGMNQHTGNWTGKTVATALGSYIHLGRKIIMVDIPGSYSLFAHSYEEEVARDFICFSKSDVNVVVCDATLLERNLNLLLQICEAVPKTILCINLIDEAKKKGIYIDEIALQKAIGIPVVTTTARDKIGFTALSDTIIKTADLSHKKTKEPLQYDSEIEDKINSLNSENIKSAAKLSGLYERFICIKILQCDYSFLRALKENTGIDLTYLCDNESADAANEKIVTAIMGECEKICQASVKKAPNQKRNRDLKIDQIITHKKYGFVAMFFLLLLIFWLTISGSNYPSSLLSNFFFSLEDNIYSLLMRIKIPEVICNVLVKGIYRVVVWIVSVMLPPMAIFFPLFTLLEDLGYLPRLAFNLDKCYKKCNTCGKQALSMCMGFGCNAAGVVGCRIIDSPREKLIAILTNAFVPCNGRFPTLIMMISIFMVGLSGGILGNLTAALILCGFIFLSIAMTFLASFILSKTVLKGVPSSFTLELPPYRRPQILKVIVRSVFDRTLFVLGRAIVAAAPAGLIIWLAANLKIGNTSLLSICAEFLDPLARIFGLDGVILIAFILGFPANEIVIPLIIMAYTFSGSLIEIGNLAFLREILINNGWTIITALNVILFSLFHWPCATTVMTIKKETGSIKWTLVAAILPTIIGLILCFITNLIFKAVT